MAETQLTDAEVETLQDSQSYGGDAAGVGRVLTSMVFRTKIIRKKELVKSKRFCLCLRLLLRGGCLRMAI